MGFKSDGAEAGGVGRVGGWTGGFDADGGVDADPPSALEFSGEVCGCGVPWSFGEGSWKRLGEEDAVLDPRPGSPAVLATAVLVPCGCLLPCRKLSGLGEVSGSEEAPAWPGSSSVWVVGVNGLVAPSS